MKNFINLKDISSKDLKKIILDAKKRKRLRKKLNTLETDKGAPLRGKILIQRFEKVVNFDLDRVIFIDQLTTENYINHLGTSSVLLDPLYFGAGNSFHESMVYGTPTITMPTKYIKSRIVTAAYIQMEIDNPPIVKNKNEYVDLAVSIANSKNLLEIKNYYHTKAKEKLFNTLKAGEEFNDVLLSLK